MKRRTRFFLHALLPPPLGWICLLAQGWIVDSRRWVASAWGDILVSLPVVVAYAYCFAIVPSLIYALLMERAYRRGFIMGRGWSLLLSSLLGGIAGAIPILGSAILEPQAFSGKKALELSPWPVAGLFTGLLIEWWIGCLIRRRSLTPSSSAPSRTSPLP
ncbi:MAG: hypothetical protein JNL39_12830 [Opitutaceae bacterium]|nr:hypothetical protein [Opitutaceae bacterium]